MVFRTINGSVEDKAGVAVFIMWYATSTVLLAAGLLY